MIKENKNHRQVQKWNYIGSKMELFWTDIFSHSSVSELVAPFKPVSIGSKMDPLLYIYHVGGHNTEGTNKVSLYLLCLFLESQRRGFSRAPENYCIKGGFPC
jgi:hypothetical protein